MPVVPWLILLIVGIFAIATVVLALILLAISARSPRRELSEIEKDYDDRPRGSAS